MSFVGVFAALLVGAMVLNVVVNPHAEFPLRIFTPVTGTTAEAKMDMLTRASAPDILVLGSSRSMRFGSEHLRGLADGEVFNLALPGGGAEDALAGFEFARSVGRTPREVWFGLGLEEFQPGPREAAPAYRFLAGEGSDLGDLTIRAASSLHPGYIGHSLVVLWYSMTGYPPPRYVLGPDGSARYPPIDASVAAGTFDVPATIREEIEQWAPGYRGLKPPGPSALAAMDSLLVGARAANVTVRLFFTPYQPDFFSAVAKEPFVSQLNDFRDVVHTRCAPGIYVQDFTDVGSFGGDPMDFRDRYHVGDRNARLLTAALVAGTSDLCKGPVTPR